MDERDKALDEETAWFAGGSVVITHHENGWVLHNGLRGTWVFHDINELVDFIKRARWGTHR